MIISVRLAFQEEEKSREISQLYVEFTTIENE